MSDSLFEKALSERPLLMDGATGTNLFDMGLVSGDAPELWNDEYPERIFELNFGFVEAGSDVVLTNTFGANAMRLKLHASEFRVSELNEKAVEIARRAASKAERNVFVAGSMGPLGELIEPVGSLGIEEAVNAFTDQALALERAGCDILWIETLSSEEELQAAAQGACRTNLPYACTGSFDTNGRTMMGVTPARFAEVCAQLEFRRPFAVGSNCGIGPAQTVVAAMEMVEALPGRFAYVAKANCGVPVWEGAKIRYTATPEQMSDYVRIACDAGASIVGGCCGTRVEHVRRMREVIDGYRPGVRPTITDVTEHLGEVFDTAEKKSSRRRRSRRRS
ncbi:MAG: betaine--homocysteine S-methyltransferase [Acidiferrobacterales bacterium]|nr:betaine--homocysteine S-methyltransferase [Acidiferrobacterales bacterium]